MKPQRSGLSLTEDVIQNTGEVDIGVCVAMCSQ